MMSEADGNCHASCSDSVFCFLHLCQYLSFHSFFSSTHLSILVLFHLSHFPFFSSLLSSSLTTSVSSSAVSRLSPSIISFFNLLSLHITKPFLCTHSTFFLSLHLCLNHSLFPLFLHCLSFPPSFFDTSQPAVVFQCLGLSDEQRQTLQRK